MKHITHLFALLGLFLLSANAVSAIDYCANSPIGYGRNATGGGNATPTLVSNQSQLETALKNKAKVIIITKNITVSTHLSISNSNTTIMALPGVQLISTQQNKDNSGIFYIKDCSNIILRNLTFVGPGAYDCDGWDLLCFDGVTNAWVDHCDFQDGCDGNFDNKGKTDNITVTWCRFHYLKPPKAGGSGGSDDHRFSNLLGSGSSDKPSDGTYNMTWAYCWWDNGCVERMLRCRNASLHFLNCYWNSADAHCYIGPENADCYIEGCTFEGAPKKEKFFYENYSGTNGVKFVNCASSKGIPSNISNRKVVTPAYSYTALTAANAVTMVTNGTCGAGATLVITNDGKVASSCDEDIVSYTVTFYANDGTSLSEQQTVPEDVPTALNPNTFTRTGYKFNGWATSATGSVAYTDKAQVTLHANLNLYAVWTETTTPTEPETPIIGVSTFWNFSDADFKALGTITENTTVRDLLLMATEAKSMTIAEGPATCDGISFTHRLQLGGAGTADYRQAVFNVSGKCDIDVYLVSSGADERTLNVCAGEFGNAISTLVASGKDAGIAKRTYRYNGGATTIRLYSAGSGINLYGIRVTYSSTPSGIQNGLSEQGDLQGVRYNMLGQIVDETYHGVVILNGKKILQ